MSLFPTSSKASPKSVRPFVEGPAARRKTWIVALTVVVITLIAMGRIAGNAFLYWDDDTNFFHNAHFNPITLNSFGYFWSHFLGDLYIPITYTIWGVLALIGEDSSNAEFGLDPHVFHVASIACHVTAAIGVLLVLRRLGLRPWPAGFGAIVFAVHPLQTEAVAWASGLKDVLSGCLCIWAIWFYLAPTQDRQETSRRRRYYLIATLLFITAMFSKPQAVCLPLVIMGMEMFRRPLAWRQWMMYLLPWLLLALPVIVLGRIAQPAGDQAAATPVINRPLVALDDLVFYAEKLIVPMDLTADYAHTTRRLLQHVPYVELCLVPPAILILAWLLRRRARWFAIGVAVFVCALIPVLGFVPFEFQAFSNVSDHYLYLAMLGPALIGACTLQAAANHGKAKSTSAAVGGVFVVSLAVTACHEAGYWTDNVTLFRRNLQLQPDSFTANIQMGTYYAKQGSIDQAITLYQRGLVIRPHDPQARFDLGNALLRQSRFPEAVDEYKQAVQAWPEQAELRENLAVALVNLSRFDEATEQLLIANHLQPTNSGILFNLANLSMQRQDVGKAKAYLSQALAVNPDYPQARQMLHQIEQMEQSKPVR